MLVHKHHLAHRSQHSPQPAAQISAASLALLCCARTRQASATLRGCTTAFRTCQFHRMLHPPSKQYRCLATLHTMETATSASPGWRHNVIQPPYGRQGSTSHHTITVRRAANACVHRTGDESDPASEVPQSGAGRVRYARPTQGRVGGRKDGASHGVTLHSAQQKAGTHACACPARKGDNRDHCSCGSAPPRNKFLTYPAPRGRRRTYFSTVNHTERTS